MRRNYPFLALFLASLILGSALAEAEAISPRISFESTVYDLGQVGLSTKNACEFKFTKEIKGVQHIFWGPAGRPSGGLPTAMEFIPGGSTKY